MNTQPDPAAQSPNPPLQQGCSRSELPTREPFGQGPFEKRTGEDRPQQYRARFRSREACCQQVTGADSRGGQQDAGEDQREERAFRAFGARHLSSNLRAVSALRPASINGDRVPDCASPAPV